MNKLFTKIATAFAGMAMAVGVGVAASSKNVSAAHADSPATLTFTAKCNGSGTDSDGNTWTVTSDGTESTFDSTKGIHYGTSSGQVTYIRLTTSGITGTITQVVVNASTASGVSATVGVKVNSSEFGGSPKSLSTSATNYTFSGSSSGSIEVEITKPEKAAKAIYCKSVSVTYSSSGCEHSWDSGTVKTAATCTTAGVMEYTCTKCGETKEEAIAALGHTWGNWVETTAATCTTDGEETRECSVCHDTETQAIAALGHNYVDGICTQCGAKEPTEVTFAYPGGSTTNMTGNNDAATLGASASDWSAVGYKNGNQNFPGLNTNGSIRLYGSSQNYIIFKTLVTDTRHLTSIVILASAKNFNLYEGEASFSTAISSSGSNPYTYELGDGVTAFTIRNNSSTQSQIQSITVAYEDQEVETYTVSFNGNTASGSMADVTDVVGDYTLPANGFTVPSGKVFTGWKANNTGNLLTAGSTYDVQADVEFYAQWSDVYTVSFNGNTASGSMADVTDVAGNYTLPANGYTVPSGKEFLGWKANNSGDTLAAGSNYVVSANVTFYAQWGNVWNVTFTAGSNGTGSKVVSVSEGTYELPSFSTLTSISANTGYQFKDYTIGGTNYNAGAEVTISAATPVTVNFEEKPLSATYDFTTNWDTYASSWGGYAAHTVTGTQLNADYKALISFTQASKQSGTITDRPVINAKQGLTSTMLFELDSSVSADYVITSVSVSMLQWGTKVVSYSLYKGTSVSGDALDSGSAGTKNTISTSNLNGDSFIVNFTSTSTQNIQLGVSSITINLKAKSSFGTLDHISVTALPNTIYHVGEYFDPTGLKVTAYDGADESTANFKDVTNEIVTLLDDTYQFVDGDVPGFYADINYEESDVTKSTSLYVHVYALAEYELVTSEPANWAGNYLLVASYTDTQSNSHTVAINSALVNFDQPLNFKEVTVVNDTITTGQECEFTVASYSTGYSMQGKNGKYAYGNSNNRFMTSDTAQALTLSLSSNIVTVTGASGYNLRMNASTHGEERFGFYNTGSADIKFYKLKESSAASTYADYFLETLSTGEGAVCDAGGESDIDDLKVAWALVAYEFTQLSGGDRGQFTEGVADEKGTNIQQAVALYDYIAWKYGHSLESEDCEEFDFMSRNITPRQNLNVKALLGGDTVNSTAIIVVASMIGLSAVGGYFFLRKRKEI